MASAEESIFIKAQAIRLRIMFRNIIDNSIKYMKRSGSLVITLSAVEEDIFIVLKDTGEGLPEEETKHIFELNFQGSNRISGNGLGLTQAKAIVDYYGGTIYGKSSPGKGMGIYIQLPMKQNRVLGVNSAPAPHKEEPEKEEETASTPAEEASLTAGEEKAPAEQEEEASV